jgi:hypothetical protein
MPEAIVTNALALQSLWMIFPNPARVRSFDIVSRSYPYL